MAKIKDVAELARVSTATVSRVINDSDPVSLELRVRVENAMRSLDYSIDRGARTLRTRKSNIIGFINLDAEYLQNPALMEVAQGVEQACSQNGYSMMIRSTSNGVTGKDLRSMLREKLVDGLIIAGILADSSMLDGLSRTQDPYVLVFRQHSSLSSDFVGADNYDGMLKAYHHLTELGHQNIAFINGLGRSTVAVERLAAYQKSVHRAGFGRQPIVVAEEFSVPGGYRGAQAVFELCRSTTALIAASDMMAFGIREYITQAGMSVPGDVSIIGFDDIPYASLGPVGLTVLRPEKIKIGQRAVELLLQRINGNYEHYPEHIVFPMELVIRHTTAAPKAF